MLVAIITTKIFFFIFIIITKYIKIKNYYYNFIVK